MHGSRFSREIINCLEEPILIIDRAFRIVDANDSAALAHGKTRRQMIGQSCFVMTHNTSKPCYEEGVSCPVKSVFETGQRTRVLHLHHVGEGERRWEEIVATPICDEAGEPVFVVEEIRDISVLLKSKEVIEQLGSEVRTLEEILPICSHCRKIRNDDGSWDTLEFYIQEKAPAKFTHGLCPDCAILHYSIDLESG